MTRKARAVVVRAVGAPVSVETIEVEGPRRGEVTVRMAACGVCHSDLSAANGTIAFPLPVVLGHEAAATLHVGNVVRAAPDIAMECCALISCGVMTGVGAAINTARVEPGSVCVVFGAGGVGLNAIQGCAIAGAAMIVAVDRLEAKLAMARQFGATHVLNAAGEDHPVKALLKLTGGGADYAFECVGHGSVVAQAYGALRKGGTAVVVGVAGAQDMTSIRTASLTFGEKTLTGSYFGSARPREDFPRLMQLYRNGRLKLQELITHRYTIDEAPQAFDDLAAGRNARGMIVFD